MAADLKDVPRVQVLDTDGKGGRIGLTAEVTVSGKYMPPEGAADLKWLSETGSGLYESILN